jgi:hypothetical protein
MKHLNSVSRMLEYLEENIDEAHCDEVEKRHLDAIHFKEGAVLPLGIVTRPEEELLPRDEAFNDPEVMLHNELLESEPTLGNVINSVYTKDDFPLHIRSNHGITLTHSILGGKYQLGQKTMPWVLSLDIPIAEYRRNWEDKPYDISGNEVYRIIMETYAYFRERLSGYPKCGRRIKLSHPNFNGPFQTAQSLMGNDFFLELYENPEDVHWLVNRITEMYLELFKIVDPQMDNQTSDKSALYIHGGIYPCRTVLRNDTAVAMLSEEHYAEFCRPCDVRIAETLGDICIHTCGTLRPFHPGIMNVPGLKGVNYGDPHLQNIDVVINEWNKKRIAVLGWGHEHPPEFLYTTLHGRNLTGFTLDCTVPDRNKAAEYVKRYREKGIEGLKLAG